jgi:NADH-quinone oxidoreductase subunit N
MYIEKGDSEEKLKIKKTHGVAIALCLIAVIILGVYPEPLLNLCADAAAFFFA